MGKFFDMFKKKQEESLEVRCLKAGQQTTKAAMRDIEPMKECKDCYHYVNYGAAHYCMNQDYVLKKVN